MGGDAAVEGDGVTGGDAVLEGLPGAELVCRGIEDAQRGLESPDALALYGARGRLRDLGIDLPPSEVADPQLALYFALGRQGLDDPYARYNAMLREPTSFLEALEGRRRRARLATTLAGP